MRQGQYTFRSDNKETDILVLEVVDVVTTKQYSNDKKFADDLYRCTN